MTQPQFTPGPWTALETREIVGAHGRTICRAHLDATTRTNGETEANARLIAAAPELLEALQNAPLPSTMGTAEEHYRRFYDWLKNVADPAIAKATGAA